MPATVPSASWGAIFDWDGVIIDSSRQHEESWERLAKERGETLPTGHFTQGFGRKNEFIIPNILHWSEEPAEIASISLRKEALYREVVAERGLVPLPGVRLWLDLLQKAGVPCAIGSSTHRANIDLSLALMNLGSFFQAIVTAEDVTLGKPHPEVFTKAAMRIDRIPQRCVVFEDAFVGIEAARAGGMKVIAVATTHAACELTMADRVVQRLDGLSVQEVAGWFVAA